jgi:ketosteroid isomerase-like protein
MSQENVEAVRAIYERWSEGDFRASLEVLDPHVVFVMGPEFPDAGAYYGVEAFIGYTRVLLEPWTRLTIEAEEVIPAGDSVLVRVRQRGVGGESGIPIEMTFFMVWSFRARTVIRLESFREHAEALEAAGLRE